MLAHEHPLLLLGLVLEALSELAQEALEGSHVVDLPRQVPLEAEQLLGLFGALSVATELRLLGLVVTVLAEARLETARAHADAKRVLRAGHFFDRAVDDVPVP